LCGVLSRGVEQSGSSLGS